MDIRECIIKYMSGHKPNEQMLKKHVLEYVSYHCNCTQGEVSKILTELKKEGLTYCVTDMSGWIGIHLEKLNENTAKHEIKSDERLNPELKKEVQDLRSGIHAAAEKQKLPERFTAVNDPNMPRMIITDTKTGRQTKTSLYAYSEVRKALNDLFS